METIQVDNTELEKIVTGINAIEIKTKEDLESAVTFTKDLKSKREKIVEFWKPLKEKAQAAHKEVVAKEKSFLEKIDVILDQQKSLMDDFLDREEKKRIEDERIARIEAERIANEEKKRIESLAKKEEKKGNSDLAEELREEAKEIVAIPETIRTSFQTTKGVHSRKKLEVEVLDLNLFVKTLIGKKMSVSMLSVMPSKLTQWINANQIKDFPGLRIKESRTAVVK